MGGGREGEPAAGFGIRCNHPLTPTLSHEGRGRVAGPETKRPPRLLGTGVGGGAEGIRTPDLRIANATLSQLSYSPF